MQYTPIQTKAITTFLMDMQYVTQIELLRLNMSSFLLQIPTYHFIVPFIAGEIEIVFFYKPLKCTSIRVEYKITLHSHLSI